MGMYNMVSLHYIVMFVILQILILYGMKKKKSNLGISIEQIKYFDNYIKILDYHLEKAFDIIYKDSILVFSIEGLRPKEIDIDNISKKFCNLSMEMLGTSLKQHYIRLYGDEQTLLLHIINYFNNRFEEDQIRDSVTNSISNSGEENVKD